MTDKLTPKNRRFVDEFLVDLNATQAAIRAGYSKKTARSQGQRLLTHADIQHAIQEAMQARTERTQITQDQVINELASIGFARLSDFAAWGTDWLKFKPSADLVSSAAIEAVEEKSRVLSTAGGDTVLDRQLKLKLHDKLKALELLGRHLGLFEERLQVSGQVVPVQLYLPDNGRAAT